MEKEVEKARKEKKTHKNNRKNIKKILLIIIAIILFSVIVLIANHYIVFDINKRTNLVINNKNVTGNLKNDILIEDDKVYLSQQDIKNFFDKYIYKEEQTNQIITTYNEKIAEIGFKENAITINGSKKQISAHVIEKDGTIYLPISEMKEVYDIQLENIKDTKVVTMDSLDREQKKALAKESVSVKATTNFISKTVDRIEKGDNVIIVSSNDDYTKIRTTRGKLGYIKTNKIENITTVRKEKKEKKQIEGKINLTWDYFSKVGSAPNREGTSIEGVNVVSPAFFYLDKDGKLQENIGESGEKYIQWAHSKGYKIWPMVSNAEAGLKVTSKIMNSYKSRQQLIEDIVKKCEKYKIEGINIDFENMKQEDKDLYSRFIIELTPRLKEKGLVTSVDVTAPDGGETWSMCFDRHVIGDVADYIIFMAYDEYGVSSTKPGTTAGYDWVKLSLNKFLQTEEIESDKIILAIPFYTRVWTTNNEGKTTSKTLSMKNTYSFIPEGTEKQWNDELKQNYVEYMEGEDKKQIWIEDIDSLKAKVSLIKENNLAGVASWQKGMESDEVWSMLKKELN